MKSLTLSSLLVVSSLAGISASYQYSDRSYSSLRKNDVIAVRFEDTLSFRGSHKGDRFTARVDNDRDLPRDTRLEGKIVDIKFDRRDRPESMKLLFDRLYVPGGKELKIRATPVVWNENRFTRDRNEKWDSKQNDRRDRYVLGGLAGGLIIGSMAKKPFEGAFIGALAGIIVGESEKARNDGVVIRKGDKVGARFERDVRVEWNDRDDRYNSRNNDRRYDREISVYYKDRELRFDRGEYPYESGRTVMVPLERTAKLLGLRVKLEDREDRISIEGDRREARLDRSSREYRLNGDRRTLSRNLETRERVLYVPLEVFKDLVDGSLKANGTKFED